MKAKLVTLHLKGRKETDETKYRRIGKAINLRKNVSWPALHWYMRRQHERLRRAA